MVLSYLPNWTAPIRHLGWDPARNDCSMMGVGAYQPTAAMIGALRWPPAMLPSLGASPKG